MYYVILCSIINVLALVILVLSFKDKLSHNFVLVTLILLYIELQFALVLIIDQYLSK